MSTRGRGRPRNAEADEQILGAAAALLAERGYRAFNVDAVSESTGIAKTTIYRRWPTKGALIAAAIAPRADGAGDAAAIEGEAAALLALLGDADGDAVEAIRAALAPRRERLRALVGDDDADARLGTLLIRALLR